MQSSVVLKRQILFKTFSIAFFKLKSPNGDKKNSTILPVQCDSNHAQQTNGYIWVKYDGENLTQCVTQCPSLANDKN